MIGIIEVAAEVIGRNPSRDTTLCNCEKTSHLPLMLWGPLLIFPHVFHLWTSACENFVISPLFLSDSFLLFPFGIKSSSILAQSLSCLISFKQGMQVATSVLHKEVDSRYIFKH